MPEYTHTTRHPIYWAFALVFTIGGGGVAAFFAFGIIFDGLAFGSAIATAIGLLLLGAGLMCVWRIALPARYRGLVSEDCIAWEDNRGTSERVSRSDVACVSIDDFSEKEHVEITLTVGGVVTVDWPKAYFGDLAKLNDDLEAHGYDTDYTGP